MILTLSFGGWSTLKIATRTRVPHPFGKPENLENLGETGDRGNGGQTDWMTLSAPHSE